MPRGLQVIPSFAVVDLGDRFGLELAVDRVDGRLERERDVGAAGVEPSARSWLSSVEDEWTQKVAASESAPAIESPPTTVGGQAMAGFVRSWTMYATSNAAGKKIRLKRK
jgi:hypothetical protein